MATICKKNNSTSTFHDKIQASRSRIFWRSKVSGFTGKTTKSCSMFVASCLIITHQCLCEAKIIRKNSANFSFSDHCQGTMAARHKSYPVVFIRLSERYTKCLTFIELHQLECVKNSTWNPALMLKNSCPEFLSLPESTVSSSCQLDPLARKRTMMK